jgi:integrase/recombinase XerD
MELLQAGAERSVIALRPGHESIKTTQVYLDANLDIKRRLSTRSNPARVESTGSGLTIN